MIVEAYPHSDFIRPTINYMQRFWSFLFTLSILALAIPGGWAQSYQAQITGIVRDPSGAAIPNVRVTASNAANGVQESTTSNAEGAYRLLALQPAQYKVVAAIAGTV